MGTWRERGVVPDIKAWETFGADSQATCGPGGLLIQKKRPGRLAVIFSVLPDSADQAMGAPPENGGGANGLIRVGAFVATHN